MGDNTIYRVTWGSEPHPSDQGRTSFIIRTLSPSDGPAALCPTADTSYNLRLLFSIKVCWWCDRLRHGTPDVKQFGQLDYCAKSSGSVLANQSSSSVDRPTLPSRLRWPAKFTRSKSEGVSPFLSLSLSLSLSPAPFNEAKSVVGKNPVASTCPVH